MIRDKAGQEMSNFTGVPFGRRLLGEERRGLRRDWWPAGVALLAPCGICWVRSLASEGGGKGENLSGRRLHAMLLFFHPPQSPHRLVDVGVDVEAKQRRYRELRTQH